jgi:hypothetical protein
MADAAANPTAAPTEKKARKPRGPVTPKPVFVVAQVLDEAGNPVDFPKDRLVFLAVTKDAAEALVKMEGTQHAFYKSVKVGGK